MHWVLWVKCFGFGDVGVRFGLREWIEAALVGSGVVDYEDGGGFGFQVFESGADGGVFGGYWVGQLGAPC